MWLETKTGPGCTAAVQRISTGRTIEFYVSSSRRENLLTDIITRHFWAFLAFWAPDPWISTGFIGGLRGPHSHSARHGQPGVGPGPGDFHENSKSRPTVIKGPPKVQGGLDLDNHGRRSTHHHTLRSTAPDTRSLGAGRSTTALFSITKRRAFKHGRSSLLLLG